VCPACGTRSLHMPGGPSASADALEATTRDLLAALLPSSAPCKDLEGLPRSLALQNPDGESEESAEASADLLELSRLRLGVLKLEHQLAEDDKAISQLDQERELAAANLAEAEAELAELTAQLHQCERVAARQEADSKMIQLQITVATQLHRVAESLSQVVGSAPASLVQGSSISQERELQETRRALKRQQQLVADAHRQLLELSTRKRPLGAAGVASNSVADLRAALAEQEMRRMMAEARADELASQVRLFEEQGLRLRLHPQEGVAASPARGATPAPARRLQDI
jgi:DNA repair exonuclease SbcCD ATPase subunit